MAHTVKAKRRKARRQGPKACSCAKAKAVVVVAVVSLKVISAAV